MHLHVLHYVLPAIEIGVGIVFITKAKALPDFSRMIGEPQLWLWHPPDERRARQRIDETYRILGVFALVEAFFELLSA